MMENVGVEPLKPKRVSRSPAEDTVTVSESGNERHLETEGSGLVGQKIRTGYRNRRRMRKMLSGIEKATTRCHQVPGSIKCGNGSAQRPGKTQSPGVKQRHADIVNLGIYVRATLKKLNYLLRNRVDREIDVESTY
jgi:hypothetical protein